MAKPFIQWQGGKGRWLKHLRQYYPETIGDYYEPFVGGGAVFWDLATRGSFRKAYLSDTNYGLICLWKSVRNNPTRLINLIENHIKNNSKNRFKHIAKHPPENILDRGAWFWYVVHAGFQGVCSFGNDGSYKGSFGNGNSLKVNFAPNLMKCSKILNEIEVEILCDSYKNTKPKTGDLVYFDPPYLDLCHYAKGDFLIDDHIVLRNMAIGFGERGVNTMLSSNDTLISREIYRDMNCYDFNVNHSMAQSVKKRKELIVVNYPVNITRKLI